MGVRLVEKVDHISFNTSAVTEGVKHRKSMSWLAF